MVQCWKCQTGLPSNANFCAKCGAKQEKIPTIPPLRLPEDMVLQQLVIPGSGAQPSNTPPSLTTGKAPLIEVEIWLAGQRGSIASKLLMVVPFASAQYRDKDRGLLEKNSTSVPSLKEDSWGEVAFIAGQYGRSMGKQELTLELKCGLWDVLVWTVQYERVFHPNLATNRIRELTIFFSDCAGDIAFLNYTLPSMQMLLIGWENIRLIDQDRKNLKKIQTTFVEKLPISAEVTQLLDTIEALLADSVKSDKSCLTKDEIERVVAAIEHAWILLDKILDDKNQKLFNTTRRDLDHPLAKQSLAELARAICHNAVFRYAHASNLPWGLLPKEQLEDVILLASFSARYSAKEHLSKAKYYSLLLDSVKRLRVRTLDPESFVSELKIKFANEEQAKAAGFTWSDPLGIATHQLNERRNAHTIDRGEADSWVRVFAGVDQLLDAEELKLFVEEVRQHGIPESTSLKALIDRTGEKKASVSSPDHPLSFLGDELRKELLRCISDAHQLRLKEILRANRIALHAELSRVLSDQTFDQILPPRHSIHIRGKGINSPDLFKAANQLIMSSHEAERKQGLELFEQARANMTGRKDMLVREWWLFALARAIGIMRALPEWEADREEGIASWEEIWNLAVFYMRTDDTKRALEILMPGVEKSRAPFSHLRFALYCAVQILIQEKRPSEQVRDTAVKFLIDYLEKLPLPVCYLVWYSLVNEYQDSAPEEARKTKQTRILGYFLDILDRPVDILRPEGKLENSAVDAFEKNLQRLGLEYTWRLWINDYAERNRYDFGAWQDLSDAWDRAGNIAQAEEALLHIVDTQLKEYKKQKKSSNPSTGNSKARLRNNLYRLFDFYRRKARLRDRNVQARFKRYYDSVPELWDGKDSANNQLIKLTRELINEIHPLPLPASSPLSEQQKKVWNNLASELSMVREIDGLKSLQERLEAMIELISGEQKLAKERATAVIKVLSQICALDTRQWRNEELLGEVDRLNGAIQNAAKLIEQEATLKPLKVLIDVFRNVFERFSEGQRLFPTLQVDPVPVGEGLPNDTTETTLVLRVINPGPGEVTNVRVACMDKGVIISNKESVIDHLAQNQTAVVAIPVTLRPPQEARRVDCQIRLSYQWGIIKDLSSSHSISVKLFSFHDFLQRHAICDYDLPNPYVFNGPIDFTRDNPHLFQGREDELSLVQTVFFKHEMRGALLYFHGMRKVGKTSLLNRIALLLKEGAYISSVVDLKGVKAAKQPLEVVVNTFTRRIRDDVQKNGLNMEGIEPVPVNHDNPIIGVEQFFHAMHERAERGRLVLLLDEFYLLVDEQTTALLDLLHRIHQSGLIWFILSGWYRPETLRRSCPETQLLPLLGRPIDFLPLSAVKKVLSEPTASFGIEISEGTVERLFLQTAGNPYHVAQIAYKGIDRLNAEHRTVLAPQDIDEIAAELAANPANFTSSSFSPLILSTEEQSVAIHFARKLGDKNDTLPVDEVTRMFSAEVIQRLEEKYIFETQGGRLRIRGKMLTTFLRSRLTEPIQPPPLLSDRKRVGIFVDYENLLSLIPPGMKAKEVGDALISYASNYGDIVCRWAFADPRNIRDWPSIKLALERAGFQVQSPSGEPETGTPKKNLTDFELIERIHDESTHTDPDIYIIVSRDKDYYATIIGLIKDEHTVRLFASIRDEHLAKKYKSLKDERERYRKAKGMPETDFFIDNLDEILRMV